MATDEVYGADPALRTELEYHRIGYVLAVGSDRRVPTKAGLMRRRRGRPPALGLATALGRPRREG